jgi:hypothetical protein
VAAVPVVTAAAVVALGASPAAAFAPTPVIARKIIGFSVKHRPIVAYHLGNPNARTTAVILGQMHGDEHAGVVLAYSIIRGTRSVEGINLWVIPTMNPDGDAAHRRQNAHGVDLNRNWPRSWRHLTGQYYSGRRALSEPETRAMYDFLRRLRPKYLVSLHQPLHGVDTTDGGAVDRAFRNRLARNLGYPLKAFRCWSVCHGSMTNWFTGRHLGIGETVEFGAHPTKSFLTGRARTGIVAALGGRFGRLADHNPRSSLSATVAATGVVHVRGWAYDLDARGTSLHYAAYRDGTLIGRGTASRPSPALNVHYHLTGAHDLAVNTTAPPGPHSYCVTFTNVGAGTADGRRCVTVTVPVPPSTPSPTPGG